MDLTKTLVSKDLSKLPLKECLCSCGVAVIEVTVYLDFSVFHFGVQNKSPTAAKSFHYENILKELPKVVIFFTRGKRFIEV